MTSSVLFQQVGCKGDVARADSLELDMKIALSSGDRAEPMICQLKHDVLKQLETSLVMLSVVSLVWRLLLWLWSLWRTSRASSSGMLVNRSMPS